MSRIPLGEAVEYPQEYAPGVLFPVARAESRLTLALDDVLPFRGHDIWNAWELTWLDPGGKPVVATATMYVPASSPNIIESKSLKLYLNSFAMTRYDSSDDLEGVIGKDLSATAGGEVDVEIRHASESAAAAIGQLPGSCIDSLDIGEIPSTVDAGVLTSDAGSIVSEELHSHLLRSNCPVTNQPDMGSILIRYRGPRIDPSSLLTYIVSFRQHNDFHEACVERMFVDIKDHCKPEALTVYARYNRRGGLDINPFRSDFEDSAENVRLWRQ